MKLLPFILLLLTWDYRTPAGDPIALPQWGITFEVWKTEDLAVPFYPWTNMDMPPVIVGGRVQEFFMVRTVDLITGEVSDWARSL